ncbi:indolepyruvate oxidoreductase subunit beta family protein [Sphingomonas populi]|uniref:Indolepyruvate oxidoreductase subunit beta family protein n=1 Tax=Sphingomonas populi TaxID=2484750 RepID=A0A4Q6Y2M6_9SPHN|nr:indolepyruvate oxidoreductase subunit beta family protein [Sphingomonas populi]RZF63527.1 indolepyruvate oxidoreductase subunit beta family protein [Sphingomonas populi]
MAQLDKRERITVAILALGGQGGGVLADWIIDLAGHNGYRAQGTSVPGVAQRTGSTVYYIEMIPVEPGDNRGEPVLALNPVPGDVDVVIASELMETGRAILRGFVSAERTTLIGSTHRIFAISEKSALGNGEGNGQKILNAAERRSKRFVGFDMDAAASEAKSVISSIMFGALAGSGALPFSLESFEAAIRAGGKAVPANLRGFALGAERAGGFVAQIEAAARPPEPTSAAGRRLTARIEAELPAPAHAFAIEGARRLMEYQDTAYAALYLDRLGMIGARDDGTDDHALSREAARHLALWMAYEDTIRVADLKIRSSRFARVQSEVDVKSGQVLSVTEYMHPRLQEVCETLPAGIGRFILARPGLRRRLEPLFAKGRHVETTSLGWFLALRLMASMRGLRRRSLRYIEEQVRIEGWLQAVREAARHDVPLATELLRNQRLIKGYSDTFERGLANFVSVMAAAPLNGGPDAAERTRRLRDAALADDTGKALAAEIAVALAQ